MARKKSNKILGAIRIFFSSIYSYFLYLDQCVKYLFFPIFGQLIALIIIFTLSYYLNNNIDSIQNISPFFESRRNVNILFCIILLPFLLVFLKAFYEYILAFSALNILFYTVSGKKKVKDIDFYANKKVIERKLPTYITLMLIVTVLLVVPPLIIVAPIIWIFLCLVFQVLAFENESNPVKIISRSIDLVKGNVISTVILLILTGILTYWFLPSLFLWAADKISLTSFIMTKIEAISLMLPLVDINTMLSIVDLSIDPVLIGREGAKMLITSLVIAFTLPYRCCCFTELYKLYDYEKIKDFSKESEEIITRATGKKRKN
ncbi:hypothetical protein IJ182_01415 [bacterium]|nr:hypothetical protein [bacterium]